MLASAAVHIASMVLDALEMLHTLQAFQDRFASWSEAFEG